MPTNYSMFTRVPVLNAPELEVLKVYRFQDIFGFVMYVTSGPSLLVESTDSMIVGHGHLGEGDCFPKPSLRSVPVL